MVSRKQETDDMGPPLNARLKPRGRLLFKIGRLGIFLACCYSLSFAVSFQGNSKTQLFPFNLSK